MSDAPRKDDPDIPQAVLKPRRRGPAWLSPSLVWVVPALALLFGAWLAFQAIRDRGPTITIAFKTAEGIEPRKTKIKYRNVEVGEVRSIALSGDRSEVLVTAQMFRHAEALLVEDTRFWVVRPRVSAGNVSGLGTLLSGSHIGMDAGKSTESRREFAGLEQPALVTADLPGRQFILHGDDLGSLDFGSPVYYKHIQVGQVVAYELDADGKGVTLRAFVDAPYDKHVNVNSRFWHADGIDFTLDANGLKVDTQSVVSILLGGLAFDNFADASAGAPADADTAFTIFADHARAMKPPDRGLQPYVMVFKESVRGLTSGAPVDFRGVTIGEVVAIDLDYDPATKEISVPVKVLVNASRLSTRRGAPASGRTLAPAETKAFLDSLIQRGLRGQLRTGNLLTQQLYIALDLFPATPKAAIDWNKTPPELPTTTGSLQELQVTLAAIAKKLEKVPFDTIGEDLQHTLRNANKLIQQLDSETAPEIRAALTDARRTLNAIEATMAADSPLQHDAHEALRDISRAAKSFRVLSDYLERHPESVIRGKKADEPLKVEEK
jgi:paraquat-inducible protein B